MTILLQEGFDSGEWTHDVRVFPLGAAPYDAQIGNIFTPKGWTFWYNHQPSQYDQPEARYVWTSDRVRSGKGAYCWFTFFRKHDAGLFRVIDAPPGKLVRVTAYPHAWSNDQNGPHKDDPAWSEWAGYKFVGCDENDLPELNGDPQNDAAGNILFNVGIDPNGGNSADPVLWGQVRVQYNKYGDPVTAEAVAGPSGKVSVWLASEVLWPFKHCDSYWDDVTVEVVDGDPVPDPEPQPQRGKPRIDYARTVNVYAEGSTEARVVEIAREAYRLGRQTVTGSYDDSAIGDLSSRTAVLWDIPVDKRPVFTAWYAQYYPGVVVEFAGGVEPDPEPEQLRLTYPSTYIPPYITQPFNATHRGLDLRGSWELWQTEALAALSGEVIDAGWTDTFGYYALVETKLDDGRTATLRYAHLEEPADVGADDLVMRGQKLGNVGGTAYPPVADHLHFSVLIGGQYVDPEPLIDWPDTPPVPPVPPVQNVKPPLTLHLQQGVEAMARFVSTCKPAGIKTVMNAEMLPGLAALNPGMRCVYRAWGQENDNPKVYVDNCIATVKNVIADMKGRGLPAINGKHMWIEAWNERGWNPDRGSCMAEAAAEIALVKEWAARCPEVGVVTLCAGVGNPDPKDFDLLIELARVTRDNGGMLGLHSYFGATPTRCSIDNFEVEGRWLESRYEMIDDYLRARGIVSDWFLGEGGAIYYQPPTNMPWSDAGFRHPECMAGNWSRYVAYLGKILQRIQARNVRLGQHVWAYANFTSGGGSQWQHFELRSPEIDDIAAMQARLCPV